MKIIWWWWSHPYYFAHDYHPICLSIPATFLGGFNGVTRFWAIWPSRHQGKVRSNSAWEGVFMDFGGFSLIRWDSQKPFVGSALSRSEEGGRPDHPGGACDGYAKVGGELSGTYLIVGECTNDCHWPIRPPVGLLLHHQGHLGIAANLLAGNACHLSHSSLPLGPWLPFATRWPSSKRLLNQ